MVTASSMASAIASLERTTRSQAVRINELTITLYELKEVQDRHLQRPCVSRAHDPTQHARKCLRSVPAPPCTCPLRCPESSAH